MAERERERAKMRRLRAWLSQSPKVKVCAKEEQHTENYASESSSSSPTKPFEQIPGPKPLPVLGNVWRYLPLIGEYKLDQLFDNSKLNYKLYGPIVREQINKKHTILHLFDPNDIETLFRLDGSCPLRRSHRALLKYRLDRKELYSSGGLFPENGFAWERLRKLFQARLMSKKEVAKLTDKIDRTVRKSLVEKLSSQIIESTQTKLHLSAFEQCLSEWAFATSLEVFLDTQLSSELSADEIELTMEQLHATLVAIDGTELHSEKWLTKPSKCKYYTKLVESQTYLHGFVEKRIHKAIERHKSQVSESNNSSEYSLLYDWLQVDGIDERDVILFVIDALLAGYHTTVYTGAHLLFQLYKNEHILDELRSHPPASDEQDELLERCLKETMRLNPVSIGTGRVVQHGNAIVRNFCIPRDTMVIAQTQHSSLNAEIFSDEPNSFRPDRWIEYRKLDRLERPSAFASLPFGFGPRVCIGKRVATLQLKALARSLIEHFDIEFMQDSILTRTTLIHNIAKPIEVRVGLRLQPTENQPKSSQSNSMDQSQSQARKSE